ncbi:MAG: hypothetical protein OIF50_08490 [Flavobacteriaceae bacterium]|nr:hypothetical protein [Flavobacteriaceae bacterium]
MKHKIKDSLKEICEEIIKENKTIEQWSEIESSDMFQNEDYNGGFDAIEEEFCFSLYEANKEYWFQFSLEDATKIASGELALIMVREADK